MILRQLRKTDVTALYALEQTAMDAPWSMAQVESELQLTTSIGFVVESPGFIHGYAIFRYCQPECELLRLAVALDQRRQGFGRTLVEKGLVFFSEHNFDSCYLEVRESNLAAQKLYFALDFQLQGRRKKYYNEPLEDALLFCRQLYTEEGY